MSTYLQLCQAVCRDVGISGGDTVPTTVASQSGELQRVVNWVKDAWTEIQNKHDNWRWMQVEFTLNTTTSDDQYAYTDCTDSLTSAAITRFSRWHLNDSENPPRAYLQSSGVGAEYWLIWMPWRDFRYIYKMGTQNDGPPVHISIDPQDNIRLGPAPSGTYVVTGEYHRSAQVFSANSDTPECPSQYQDLIKYMAMGKYALYESAQEVLIAAEKYGNPLMSQLEVNQLPRPRLGDPMA